MGGRTHHIAQDFIGSFLPGLHVEDVSSVCRARAEPVQGLQVVDEIDGTALEGDQLRHRGLQTFLQSEAKS